MCFHGVSRGIFTLLLYFNIMFPSLSRFPKLSLFVTFPHQNPICFYPLPYTCYMPHPSILLDFITLITSGGEYKSGGSSVFGFLELPVTSFVLGPPIFLSTIFLNALSLSMRNQVSHLCNTTDAITAYYILCNMYCIIF